MKITKGAKRGAICLAACAALAGLAPAGATTPPPAPAPALTYADLADLADPAQLVLRVKITRQSMIDPARSPGLLPGKVRLYVEAKPEGALAGQVQPVKVVKYLVDVPVGADRRVPTVRGKSYIVFARAVPGKPEELQLVAPDAQLPADPATAARLMPLLAELADPGAPPRIAGIRDILSVQGNLAGESETQLFLDSVSDGPVLVSVVRRPGASPIWSVSWSELVDQAGRSPAPDTLAWYRLACTLPDRLPAQANLARGDADRSRALRDYALIKQELGGCARTRK